MQQQKGLDGISPYREAPQNAPRLTLAVLDPEFGFMMRRPLEEAGGIGIVEPVD
jgi:hypothetical protein